MSDTTHVFVALCAHFLADFVLQSDDMAKRKSSEWSWLAVHVATYTVALAFVMTLCLSPAAAVTFAAINGGAHFVTDAITSRASSALWKKGETHWFFVVIGFDQLAHTVLLVLTLPDVTP